MKDPKRVAIGRKSKRKGGTYERKIAKILNSWWCGKDSEMMFFKTPSSGGLRWKIKQAQTVGDIVGPDNFPFIVSCKNVEGWSLDQLLGNNTKDTTGPFTEWINEVNRDAARLKEVNIKKEPLLIFTRNNRPDYILRQMKFIDNIYAIPDSRILVYLPTVDDLVVISKLSNFIKANTKNL